MVVLWYPMKMDNAEAIVNNQNIRFREIYRWLDYTGKPNEYLIEYIPIARYLIDKYATEDWKHNVNHLNYVFREYQICTLMHDFKTRPRESLVKITATVLSVNPILLFNDPDLPF